MDAVIEGAKNIKRTLTKTYHCSWHRNKKPWGTHFLGEILTHIHIGYPSLVKHNKLLQHFFDTAGYRSRTLCYSNSVTVSVTPRGTKKGISAKRLWDAGTVQNIGEEGRTGWCCKDRCVKQSSLGSVTYPLYKPSCVWVHSLTGGGVRGGISISKKGKKQ